MGTIGNIGSIGSIGSVGSMGTIGTIGISAAERGGGRGGQLAPGPKQVGAPNLRNILKLNKAPSKSGRVQGINGCI